MDLVSVVVNEMDAPSISFLLLLVEMDDPSKIANAVADQTSVPIVARTTNSLHIASHPLKARTSQPHKVAP
jgi:hypothetical protein